MPFGGGAGGLEAGKAFVDLVPRLSPDFAQKTSSMLGSGLKPATGKLTNDLEKAGADAGTKAGTAAGKNLSTTMTSSASTLTSSVSKLFIGLGAARFFTGAISEAREAVKVGQLTEAVIKSTGGAAQVSAPHVGELANKLSMLAGVDDELIQQGENVLLTFTAVQNKVGAGNDIFDQATGIALDMSRALGTDLQGSIIQVGKALNDPIQGVGALRRVGVQLSDEQEELVKHLVETGDVLGAQKVILAELTKEFGGAAAAAADPADKAAVAMGNLQEVVGTQLLPVITELSTVFANDIAPTLGVLVQGFGALPGPVQAASVGLIGIGFAAGPIGRVAKGLGDVGRFSKTAVVGLGKGGLKAAELSGKLVVLVGRLIATGVQLVAAGVKAGAQFVAGMVKAAAQAVISGARMIASFIATAASAIVNAAITAAAWLLAAGPFILLGLLIAAVVYLIIQNWDTISAATVAVWQGIVDFIGNAVSWIVGFVSGLPGQIIGFFQSAWDGAFNAVTTAAENIISFVTGIPGRILGALGGLGSLLWDAGVQIIQGLINGASSLLGKLGDFFSGLKDKIFGWKGPPDKDRLILIPAGVQIMRGLVAGAESELGNVETFFSRRVPGAIGPDRRLRLTASAGLDNVSSFTPAASAAGGAPTILNGPLFALTAVIRDDGEDVVTLSRRLAAETNRQLRAMGEPVSA